MGLTGFGRRLKMIKTCLAFVTALSLVGCAISAKDTARFQRPTIDAFPVAIVAIDGAAVAGAAFAMQPGLRKVTVQMPAEAGFKTGEQRTIDLMVKACTKYWLVAMRDSRVGDQFEVKVDHEQRVYPCEAPRAG